MPRSAPTFSARSPIAAVGSSFRAISTDSWMAMASSMEERFSRSMFSAHCLSFIRSSCSAPSVPRGSTLQRIVVRPASAQALQRRSPQTNRYRVRASSPPTAMTAGSCRRPCRLMLSARRRSFSSSNARRGCVGSGSMASIGISSTAVNPSGPVRSAGRGPAASTRPAAPAVSGDPSVMRSALIGILLRPPASRTLPIHRSIHTS